MNRDRLWNVLCWNIRGLNDPDKWPSIRNKIEESNASIICLQETKKMSFDASFIRGFAPRRFDKFAYVPSEGASGGLLVIWNSKLFEGQVLLEESFGIAISFTSAISAENFTLVNVYGPCNGVARENFVAWLFSLDIADDALWLLLGDFNFYRFAENRNQEGANLNDIAIFNEIISYLGLIELPIKGRAFTWSNMQLDPLMVQLDWFFTSTAWTLKFPNTLVSPLARPTSDHVPCVVSIGTNIPKAKVFRFENHWIRLPGFLDKVKSIWEIHCPGDSAKCLSAKFKRLRKGLKQWSSSFGVLDTLISNCNRVIFDLDSIEEQRQLHITEWNFRDIVKSRLQQLLLCKQDYWRKRCTARWARLGDENTSFFHSMATIRYRSNLIASLNREDGSQATEHHEKAGLLWESFRQRLGISVPINPEFDFSQFFSPFEGLSGLSAPFTHEEIDKVVAHMPSDKSPGPDGFSGLFLKICWPVVKYDFYRLCQEFWEGKVNLQSINDSYITLIPKTLSPEGPNDYRPISLLNICMKLLTKLLADRLQNKILEMVHINQYGFLKSRNIQDCVGWAYEYIHQCKQSGTDTVILKLDFAKAFDTVEHEAVLKVFESFGFDPRWLNWMRMIMSTGTSAVLLNGVPGKKFACRRGVRQGDPFSPLLFVSVAELLQIMVNQLFQNGILSAPLNIPNTDFPIVQYADDTLLILRACPVQLAALKVLLETFAQATGLRVNYSKSSLLPVNVTHEQMEELAAVFGCAIGTLPFTYLGLPLGITKPTIQDLTPLVGLVERRLNSSARFLGYGGRLEFVRSVLSSLPNFFMCSLKIQKAIINICNRAQRHCLWAKEEDSSSSNALAAWSLVCRPRKHGGLGVLNLEIQNKALLMKQLHKFYSKENVPWVNLVWSLYGDRVPHAQSKRGSFWWRDIFSLSGEYRSITQCQVGSGTSVLAWKDFWMDGGLLCDRFPRLFSFVIDEDLSVAELSRVTDLNTCFALPLSEQAFQEWGQVSQILSAVSLTEGAIDKRSFVWGNSYAPSKYYNFLFSQLPQDKAFNAIWASKTLPKLKVFCWLLMMDRLNTKDIMQRKHWHVDSGPECVLCNAAILETKDHLFFECDFARHCWEFLHIPWAESGSFSEDFVHAKAAFPGPCFMEVFACAVWNIWRARNDFIFRNIQVSFNRWKVGFQSDLFLHKYKVKSMYVQPLVEWIASSFT